MADDLHERAQAVLAKQLFFVGGTEKSGTTWLQLMLDAHPEATCRGEGHFFDRLAPDLGRLLNEYGGFVGGLNERVFAEIAPFPTPRPKLFHGLARTAIAGLMAEYATAPGLVAVGEKTPATVRCLGRVEQLFPEAKVILILRDGRDVVVSGWFHVIRQHGRENADTSLAAYCRRVARAWRHDTQAALAFRDRRPEHVLLLRYEDLHAAAEPAMARTFRFLGLDSGPKTVAAAVAAGRFEQVSGGRGRGEEDRDSQFRKGIVGDWKNHFDAETEAIFQEEAGDVLRRLEHVGPAAVAPA